MQPELPIPMKVNVHPSKATGIDVSLMPSE